MARGSTTRATRVATNVPRRTLDFFQQLYFHELGTPTREGPLRDRQGVPAHRRGPGARSSPGPAACSATVQNGDSGEFALHLPLHRRHVEAVRRLQGRPCAGRVRPGRRHLYVVSRKDAPRGQIVKLSAEHPDKSKAAVVVPEGEDTIVTEFLSVAGPSRRCCPPRRGCTSPTSSAARAHSAPSRSTASRPAPKQPKWLRSAALCPRAVTTSLRQRPRYTEAGRLTSTRREPTRRRSWALNSPAVVDFSDIEVVREFATSKDGTKVPVNILMKKGTKLDGSNPCLGDRLRRLRHQPRTGHRTRPARAVRSRFRRRRSRTFAAAPSMARSGTPPGS